MSMNPELFDSQVPLSVRVLIDFHTCLQDFTLDDLKQTFQAIDLELARRGEPIVAAGILQHLHESIDDHDNIERFLISINNIPVTKLRQIIADIESSLEARKVDEMAALQAHLSEFCETYGMTYQDFLKVSAVKVADADSVTDADKSAGKGRKKQKSGRKMGNGEAPATAPGVPSAPSAPSAPKIKFMNPNNPNETWTGRGPRPPWMRELLAGGCSVDQLRVIELTQDPGKPVGE